MTRLEQVQEALAGAQAALDAVHVEAAKVNAQENDLRRRYPSSMDALERATISLALQQEIPALQRRIEAKQQSAIRDVDSAQAAVDAVKAEIALVQATIAKRIQRTESGGFFDAEIDRIRANVNAQIAALESAKRDELGELSTLRGRLAALGGL